MKIIGSLLLGGVALTASFYLAHAQTDSSTQPSLADDTATMIEAIEQATPVPFNSLPNGGRGGTFWSAQHAPGTRAPWPPLPGDIYGLDVWPLGDGQYLFNDTNFDYSAFAAAMEAAQAPMASPMTRFSMMASSLASSYAYGNPVYLTNMAVSFTNDGSITANFSIGGGTNFVPYDILMSTNLTIPVGNWNFIGIGYTSNNYTFYEQPTNLGFYILAKPSKTMTVGIGDDTVGQCDVPYGLTNVIQVAAGRGQSLALKTDGTVVAWGENVYGQGVVPANLSGVAMVSAGYYHNVALLTNGTVTAWGLDDPGLGYYLTNVPANLSNVTVIAAGGLHTLALCSNGTVVAWGYDNSGETNVPVGLTNVTAISAGYEFSLAVSNGYVVAWGNSNDDELDVPAGLSNVVDVEAGPYHSLALLQNGTVAAWGDDQYGETDVPAGLSNVVAIAAGGDPDEDAAYSMALKNDGTITVWGDDDPSDPVGGLTNVIGIAAGNFHALAVRTGPRTPVITLEPTDQYQVTNGTVTFTSRGAGLYGVTYQWQTNGVSMAGATNDTLILTNVQAAQLDIYDVVVTDIGGMGSIVSSNVNLNFVTPPVILSETLPTNQIGIYNSNLTLNVVATAPGSANGFPLSYQWQFNGTNISGANSATYTFHVNANSFGTYSVQVSNAAGSTNAAWQVSVYYPSGLLITQQPTNQYQIAGGTINFYGAGVSSNAVTYQWAFNGTNILGATNATLTITNVQSAQQGYYNFVLSDGVGSVISSNGTFYLVTPPVITSQTTPTNFTAIYGNYFSFAATATSPFQSNGYPLHYQWQLNGTNLAGATSTNYSFTVNDTNGGTYSLVASNAAGSMAASWQVIVTNAINVTNDLLLIYNTNSPDSTAILNYYLAHRPNIGGANVLGLGYTNPVSPGYYEAINPSDLTNQILNPVGSWLTNNPTKRPQYIVLMMDLPSRVTTNTIKPAAGNGGYYIAPASSSVCVQFWNIIPNWQPFVTHLNMGMTNTVNRTNDCIAYINKLATIGVPISSGSPVLSASAGGYSNTNYVLDSVRGNSYAGNSSTVGGATNGLLSAGVSPDAIEFYDGLESSQVTNNIFYYTFVYDGLAVVSTNAMLIHATNTTNIAGYASWGSNGFISPFYTIDGTITWSGNSGWWLINTIESYNGEQIWLPGAEGSFTFWFTTTAFGGTNYSNTPVGAVSTVDEPYLSGKNDNSIYFGLWASGKNFGICAWNSRGIAVSPNGLLFQATGDPLIEK